MVTAGDSPKVKVAGDGSVSSESMTEYEIGTPVDELDGPLIPVASKPTMASPKPAKPSTENIEKASLSGHISGLEQLSGESNAPIATPESLSKHAKIKGGPSVPVKAVPATNGDTAAHVDDQASVSKAKSDRLAKIEQAINDFDPSPLYDDKKKSSNKKAEEGVKFSKDINDETLIDDLIKGSETDTNEKKGDKGKVTPGKGKHTDKANKPPDSLTVSPLDASDNPDDKSPDGSMSASTESDGFQDDGVNGDGPEEKQGQTTKPEGKQAQNKSESQKVDNSSSKTGKSKKREDKSIGKFESFDILCIFVTICFLFVFVFSV